MDQDGNPITKSNSKPKAEYHYMVATALFGNPKYGFNECFKTDSKTPAGQKLWGGKIKAKLE